MMTLRWHLRGAGCSCGEGRNTFFSWVFQFGDSIAIEGPGEVKEAYEALLRRALKRQEV